MINSIRTFNLTFFSRYLGSKSWSIPEKFLEIINKINPFSNYKNTKISSYQWSFIDGKEHIKKKLPFYILVGTCYSRYEHATSPFNFFVNQAQRFNLQIAKHPLLKDLIIEDDAFLDVKTGFKARVSYNGETNHCMVSFGYTGSFKEHLSADKTKLMQINCKQDFASFTNLLGAKPLIYKQADQFIKAFKEAIHPDIKVTTCGSCLGGSLAQYAALQNSVKAYTLNSLPLGAGLQEDISENKLQTAHKYIRHLTIKNDWVSDNFIFNTIDKILSIIFGIRTPGNFGKRYVIQDYKFSPFGNHINPFECMAKALDDSYVPFSKERTPFQVFNAYAEKKALV